MPKFLRPVSSYGDFDKMNTNDQRKNKFRHSRLMRHAIPYPEENERPPQSKAAPSGFGCFFCVKDTTTDTSLQSEKAGLV